MKEILKKLGIKDVNYGATNGRTDGWIKTTGKELISYSPIDGKPLATVIQATPDEYEVIVKQAEDAFKTWRMYPAPKRGQIVKEISQVLVDNQEILGELVSLEMGKIKAEGMGEVQEMIDIADFSVGISRQLYGLSMHSEREEHSMKEQWHPLGIVGIITSFNFPVAVWAWNAMLDGVCGDVNIWKPSSKVPLCSIAVQNLIAPIVDKYDIAGVFNLVIGAGRDVGEKMINDKRIPLISATGSTAVGRKVGEACARRFGRSLLELGGNNAIIVAEDADMDMAIRATLFGAVGTAGQRCTSTRRIIIQKDIKAKFLEILTKAYGQVKIGSPLDESTLMGPLIDEGAVDDMMNSIKRAKEEGGVVLYGGEKYTLAGNEDSGTYVLPTIMEVKNEYEIVQEETFAPLLYIIEYDNIDEAIELHNDVPQGLSSAIFTNNMRYEHLFLSHKGSDCGIANCNIGTSGAEIGGAFGGEKETGGGRESGSDAWKVYMRRQTNTINWGSSLPLAQGIKFDV